MSSSLWARIELASGHKGWSQSDLAKVADVSRSALSNIKAGTSHGGGIFAKLASALEVDPEWLRSGADDLAPEWLRRSRMALREEVEAYNFDGLADIRQALREHGAMLRLILSRLAPDDHSELIRAALAVEIPPFVPNPERVSR